jgi:sodium transport system permease protein
MSIYIKDIWLVAQRELRHYFRDPHVLIYSVLMPALLYPATIVLMIEGGLWQESLAEKRGVRVALTQPLHNRAFEQALRVAPDIKIVNAEKPFEALRNAEIDAVIRADAKDSIEIFTPPRIDTDVFSPRLKLANFVDGYKRDGLRVLLAQKGHTPEQLTAFLMRQTNVSKVATSLTTIIPYGCTLALMIMTLGAIYPAISAFTEEREKKTLEATLTMPVSRLSLVLGKHTATSVVTLLSSLLNLVCILSVVALMGSLPQTEFLQLQRGPWFTPSQICVLSCVFVVNAWEVSALFLLLSQFTRTFREAQNLLTLPSLLLSLMSITALSPSMTLTIINGLIPFLNSYVVCKAIFSNKVPWELCALALLVNLFITIVLLFVLSRVVEHEQFGLVSTSFRKLFKVIRAKS